LKNSSLHIINYIRHTNAQNLFKNHVSHAHKFCTRPTSKC